MTWRCQVVVVVGVVEWLREVVGIGGGGDEAEVVEDVVEKERVCLFTICCELSANAAYAAQYKDTTVAYMIYYVNSY